MNMFKYLFLFLLFFSSYHIVFGQDTLPHISVTQLGNKVLVSWNNPFNNVTGINIQRSSDSSRNFTTIGSVLNVSAKSNGFVDTKEFIPNEQYYRVFVTMQGGNYFFSPAMQPVPDTVSMPAEVTINQAPVKTWFVPSRYVYTGRDNNVVLSLPSEKNKYSVKFFESNGDLLFEIKNLPENYLILDKVNFGHSGLFGFELFENGNLLERHKVYIPKDGKPMPALDVNGNEIPPGQR